MELTSGSWKIGLNVLNHGDIGSGWYTQFDIWRADEDAGKAIVIPASDNEVNHGFLTTEISLEEAGEYKIQYTWLNDYYIPDYKDANIQINSVFFDNLSTQGGGPAPVPEPGTMLLLGTGLIGLAGMSRKKMFRK